jgi:uncharacterized FAD-dependent dehydrogenase
MIKTLRLQVPAAVALQDQSLLDHLAIELDMPANSIAGYIKRKQSIDARNPRRLLVHLQVDVFINEPLPPQPYQPIIWKTLPVNAPSVIIIGSGPAGLFAALQLIEKGIRPILLERGKDVQSRRRDLATLNRTGAVNPDSNYCFGEGGAGTYSDGKLYTRSSKRGNVQRILQIFHQLGAPDAILYQAHPHIGTNLLPRIISAMRQQILEAGGLIHFGQRVTDFELDRTRVKKVFTQSGDEFTADGVILATGHSARDIFELFKRRQWQLEAKPFALGIRIEHPQTLIDSIQYHTPQRNPLLPPASYSLVEQVNQRGVFSFCMCPGGIIAPAATAPGELVVNGWSPSKRNNPYANSGLVVQVELSDALNHFGHINENEKDPLLLMRFQEEIEKKAFVAGGGNLKAPAQRMVDFANGKPSSDLPGCSYVPGITAVPLPEILPNFISDALRKACRQFGHKMKGYFTNEALLVATESRTSSPVRIPRDAEKLTHPQLENLYPCGEGAGYAGGIVSAAMDGERVALAASLSLSGK